MRRNPTRPDPGEIRQVSVLARAAAEDLDHAVAAARTIGLVVDDEIFECSAHVLSWASWLAARAAQANDQTDS
jgi:hypothetical protein